MSKYKINNELIIQKIGNKIKIFSGENSALFTLNETAGYIFQCLKRGWSKKKIGEGLESIYSVERKQAEMDVEKIIEDLKKMNILYEK